MAMKLLVSVGRRSPCLPMAHLPRLLNQQMQQMMMMMMMIFLEVILKKKRYASIFYCGTVCIVFILCIGSFFKPVTI